MTELDAELFDSLAAKIEGLDLTEDESQTFDLILSRAAALDSDDDVSGFQFDQLKMGPPREKVILMRSPVGQKLGLGAGMINASVLTPTAEGRV